MDNILNEEHKAIECLRKGGVILCPTDTIWGLSCDALDHDAVRKIYRIKDRPENKPLILLVHSVEQLKEYIVDVHPRIETLLHYHRRPVTVIYEANDSLPDYLSDDKGTVAIRVIKEPSLSNIISELDHPIISTSANISDTPSPISYNDISHEIINNVDYILYPGSTNNNKSKSSMLIGFDDEGELIFFRK